MTQQHLAQVSFHSDPNIGLYVFATNAFAIVGQTIQESDVQTIERVLKVPVFQTTICGTSLAGVFLSGDETTILVPTILFDHERKILEKTGAKILVVDTKNTALGNSLIFKNNALIYSEIEESVITKLQKQLGVSQTFTARFADTAVIGSIMALNDNGGLAHPKIEAQVLDKMEEILGLPITVGTVNYGSPFCRSGVICNKNGFLIGNLSSGPEVVNADQAFGFLDE